MEKLNLSSPWLTFVSELRALFDNDPDVEIVYDDEEKNVKVFVDNGRKAEALARLLPSEKEFGNVTISIDVVPANSEDDDLMSLLVKAFEGNSAVADVKSVETVMGTFNYVIFKREVVQFFNDQLDDINGNKSTLYQEIAKDIFNLNGVHFCTDDGSYGLVTINACG